MGSNSDQYVLMWIYLMFHDSAEELCQVFDEWKMALMRERKNKQIWQQRSILDLITNKLNDKNNNVQVRVNKHWRHFHTHKGSSVLMHHGTPTHSLTKGINQELRWREIRDALIKVYSSVALC